MSKIEDLIEELCPHGVPIKALKEVCLDFIVPMRDRPSDLTGAIPWCRIEDVKGQTIDSSKTGLGVSPATIAEMNLKVYPVGTVLATFSASLGTYAITSAPIITNQTFIGLVCGEELFNRFLMYVLEISTARLAEVSNSGTIPYISRKKFEEFRIPIPPIEVQREIVSILDKFTQLEAELEAELEARKSQYEHTGGQLLNFSGDLSAHPMSELIEELCPEGIPLLRLGDLLTRRKGAPVTATSMKELPLGDQALRVFAGGRTLVDVDKGALDTRHIISGPGIIVKSRGIIDFAFWDGVFSHKNELWSYTPRSSELELKFAYYLLRSNTEFFINLAKSKSVKMPQLTIPDTDDYLIPVPPLEVQREIVSILDKFDALANDLSSGLPAELAARRKQYEHYRNKLLTFKEPEAA